MTEFWSILGGHTGLTVIAGAALIGALAGVLGAFAVLRRQSLLGDTLSHAALPGVCVGFLVAGAREPLAILAGALGAGALAALAASAIPRVSRLKPDAAMAIVLSGFFAVGVVLLSVVQGRASGAQAGLADFLFGQAAAILRADLIVMAGVATLCLGLIALWWKECQIVAFDPDLARLQGVPAGAVQAGLTALMALAIVVGLQVVGVVLMVALLIAPAVAARLWVERLGPMVILSGAFGAASGIAGALVSAMHRDVATGPVIVLVAVGAVMASLVLAPRRGIIAAWRQSRADRAALDQAAVLAVLRDLARAHGDPAYRAEGGMLDAALGTRSRPALETLARAGLARKVAHPPETTPHWELTEAGLRRIAAGEGG
ncbi:MAG: metal ABC transporter permease [Gemmobacter sp.]|jgi:manganese/zinc/iron transport system permease protein